MAAEKEATAVEKRELGVKTADEEKGMTAPEGKKTTTAVEKGEKGSTAAGEDVGDTAEGKGKKRATVAVEEGSTDDWELEWKWKGAAAADAEEGSKPRRERRRWRSTTRDRGAAVEKEKDTAVVTEGPGENSIFLFSADAAEKMLTLVSSEGQPFRVSEAAARHSLGLADMIDNDCAGGNIPVPNVDDRALAMVIKYCDKHAAALEPNPNHGAADEGGGGSSSSANTETSEKALHEWDRKFIDDLTQDALFDLIVAANFLEINGLLKATCQKVADMVRNKSPAQVRTIFSIANDFTAEDEEEIRRESPWVFDDEEA